MTRAALVVTGVARHSLGEAFVRNYSARAKGSRVVAVDRAINPDLIGLSNVHQLTFDLNPLGHPGGFAAFATALAEGLTDAISGSESAGVAHLIQCAGVYEFGRFVDHDLSRRARVLGVNILGATEILHTVMALNDRIGRRNESEFAHVLIGSFQGLYARARRSLYAASKAYGLDLCTSLVEGGEVGKCLYVAAGPIDTPMLHWNHWVTKARGSEAFFAKVLAGPCDRYRAIFVECNESMLDHVAREECGDEAARLASAMALYRTVRNDALGWELGVVSPEACGGALARMLTDGVPESGVYMLRGQSDGGEVRITMTTFSDLNRRRIFESAEREVP